MGPTKNLPLLMHLIFTGYNRALPNPNGGRGDFQPIFNADGTLQESFCDDYIQYILNGFGYGAMNGMLADAMVAYMKAHTNEWIGGIDDATAQFHANNGVIVIPGWSNPDGHGHVNIVLPGILEKSGTWARPVPQVANVGKDVFIGQRISFAFTLQEMPTYFALSSQI